MSIYDDELVKDLILNELNKCVEVKGFSMGDAYDNID